MGMSMQCSRATSACAVDVCDRSLLSMTLFTRVNQQAVTWLAHHDKIAGPSICPKLFSYCHAVISLLY